MLFLRRRQLTRRDSDENIQKQCLKKKDYLGIVLDLDLKIIMANFSASAPPMMGTFQPGTAGTSTSIVELSMAAR